MTIKFNQDQYISPTNKAIFETMMSTQENPHEKAIKQLLAAPELVKLSQEFLLEWLQTDDLEAAVLTLKEMQAQNLIKGLKSNPPLVTGASDEALNACMTKLSDQACLLANDQGFQLANAGFVKDHADELAAVAAELNSFHLKRVQQLVDKGVIDSNIWSILSHQANSRLSFWPLHTDHQKFILIIKGPTQFNNNGLLDLARVLMNKYNH